MLDDRPFRRTIGRDPKRGRVVLSAGDAIATATRASVGVALGAASCGSDWSFCDPHSGSWDCGDSDDFYWSFWWSGGFGFSWAYNPFSYCYYNSYGYWPYGFYSWWQPYYAYSAPYQYATVVHHYYYDDPAYYDPPDQITVINDSGINDSGAAASEYGTESVQVGEGVALAEGDPERADLEALLSPNAPDTLARAARQYLSLGDSAFREGRYNDAVQHYANAVEFSPREGVFYLVLSDALLATGDYHYGAFALRKALVLDPSLCEVTIDKHDFYGDPGEFDRHVAVLESYLEDRPADDDARLLLAANYLFGGRPAAAVDLLGSDQAAKVRAERAAEIILAAARERQFGPSTGVNSGDGDQ